ncbi:hypothetical protein [Ravibacter arvi]
MERTASIEWVSKDKPSTGSGAVRMVPSGWCLSASSGWRLPDGA